MHRSIPRPSWRRPVGAALAVVLSACADGPTEPTAGLPEAAYGRVNASIVVEAPARGARLVGTTTFRARAEGMNPGAYAMTWQVDHGQANPMTSVSGAKEARVDVSSWTWKGEGPYRLTFRATDARGRTLGTSDVDVYVGAAAVLVAERPTEGETLSGATVFRAALEGRDASTYSMTWRVDGGQANAMAPVGGSYEAPVDVSGWSWNGAGPYRLTFTATAPSGAFLAAKEVSVMVAADGTGGTGPGTGTGPLAGARFWVDPYSNAAKQAEAWRLSRPADAAYMDVIASEAQADWFGDWSGDVRAKVAARTSTIVAAGGLPVYVAYNLPVRDCSSYSGGGAVSGDAYRSWIRAFTEGLAGRPAAVVLEPDGLALMDCLSAAQRQERLALLADAVRVLAAGGAWVYLDAGHARWHSAAVIAERLRAAGVADAAGFALNVSNFVGNAESVAYGEAVSALVGGARFVVDSSRNGLGPAADGAWCNPDGRALGTRPTTVTGHALVDAFLWIKLPGESDGTCNGGPSAGAWWADYALGLAKRAVESATTTAAADR